MKKTTQFHIRPARPDEAGLFYAQHPEEDKRLGAVGHVRMDFGRSGNEFWHTWWPRGPEELNSPAFKAELQQIVGKLREDVLKSRFAMERFCYDHGGKIDGGYVQNYGYIVETERYRYCLRCNPSPGDYNGYLTAYDLAVQRQNMARDKPLVGRVTYANGDTQEFTDAEAFLKCVREELPYRPTTGFRYEVLADDPSVRRQVDDMIFDLYGEEAPCRQEDHEPQPEQGMTFGFSRDDAGKFLGAYYDKKIYENDPFAKLDQKGVGKLVDMACKLGRSVNPDLHLGICGEHGGDPSSVEFCHRTGLDYVSCSPFRVPIARLAAAQAAIREEQ